MAAKKYRDEYVEMEAFTTPMAMTKWIVFTYYIGLSRHLGYLIKRCNELPKEYPLPDGVMVPIEWKRARGEQVAYAEHRVDEFLAGMREKF